MITATSADGCSDIFSVTVEASNTFEWSETATTINIKDLNDGNQPADGWPSLNVPAGKTLSSITTSDETVAFFFPSANGDGKSTAATGSIADLRLKGKAGTATITATDSDGGTATFTITVSGTADVTPTKTTAVATTTLTYETTGFAKDHTLSLTGLDVTLGNGTDNVVVVNTADGTPAMKLIDGNGFSFTNQNADAMPDAAPTMGTFLKLSPTVKGTLTLTGTFTANLRLYDATAQTLTTPALSGATATISMLTPGHTYYVYQVNYDPNIKIHELKYALSMSDGKESISISNLLYNPGTLGISSSQMNRKIPKWRIEVTGKGNTKCNNADRIILSYNDTDTESKWGNIDIIPDVPEAQKENIIITSVKLTIKDVNKGASAPTVRAVARLKDDAGNNINDTSKPKSITSAGAYTWSKSAGDWTYEPHYVNIRYASNDGSISISEVEISYTYVDGTEFNESKGVVALEAYAPDSYKLESGQSETVTSVGFAEVTDDNAAYTYPAGFGGTLTYSSDNDDIATYDGTTLTMKASGQATITTRFAGTDYFAPAETTFTVASETEVAKDGTLTYDVQAGEVVEVTAYAEGTSHVTMDKVADGSTDFTTETTTFYTTATEDGTLTLTNGGPDALKVVSFKHYFRTPELFFKNGNSDIYLRLEDTPDGTTLQNEAKNAYADAGAITYSSDNTAVATVDENTGKVTLKGIVGTATITATSAAVSGKYTEAKTSYTIHVAKTNWDFSTFTTETFTGYKEENWQINDNIYYYWKQLSNSNIPLNDSQYLAETDGLTFNTGGNPYWYQKDGVTYYKQGRLLAFDLNSPSALMIAASSVTIPNVPEFASIVTDMKKAAHGSARVTATNAIQSNGATTTTWDGNANIGSTANYSTFTLYPTANNVDVTFSANTYGINFTYINITYPPYLTNTLTYNNGYQLAPNRSYEAVATAIMSDEKDVTAQFTPTYSSSDATIAEVDPTTGAVTAKRPGYAVITVTYTPQDIHQYFPVVTSTVVEVVDHVVNADFTLDVPKLLYQSGATAADGGMDRRVPCFDVEATGSVSSGGQAFSLSGDGKITLKARYTEAATAADAHMQVGKLAINFAQPPYGHNLKLNGWAVSPRSDNLQWLVELPESALKNDELTLELAEGAGSVLIQSMTLTYTLAAGTSMDADLLLDASKLTPTLRFLVPEAIDSVGGDGFQNTLVCDNIKNFNMASYLSYAGDNDAAVTVAPLTGEIQTVAEHDSPVSITATMAETDYFKGATGAYTVSTQQVLLADGTFTFEVKAGQVVEVTAWADANGQHLINTAEGLVLANDSLVFGKTLYTEVTTADADGTVTLKSTGNITIKDVNVYWLPFEVTFSYAHQYSQQSSGNTTFYGDRQRSFVYYDLPDGDFADSHRFHLDNPTLKVVNRKTGEDVANYFNVTYTSSDESYATVDAKGTVTGVKEKLDGVVITATLTPKSGLDDTQGYRTLTAQYVVNVIPFKKEWDFTQGDLSLLTAYGLNYVPSVVQFVPGKGLKLTPRPIKADGNIDIQAQEGYVDVPVRAGMKVTVNLYTDDAELLTAADKKRYTARMTTANTTTTEYLVSSVLDLNYSDTPAKADTDDDYTNEYYAYEDGFVKFRNTTGYSGAIADKTYNADGSVKTDYGGGTAYDVPPMDVYIRSITVEQPTLIFQDAVIGSDDVNQMFAGISQGTIELVPKNLHDDYQLAYERTDGVNTITTQADIAAEHTKTGVTRGTGYLKSGTESTTGFGAEGTITIRATASKVSDETPDIPIRPVSGIITMQVTDMKFETTSAPVVAGSVSIEKDAEDKEVVEDGMPVIDVVLGSDGGYTFDSGWQPKGWDSVTPKPVYSCSTPDISETIKGHITNSYDSDNNSEGTYSMTVEGVGTLVVTATSGTMSASYKIRVKEAPVGVFANRTPSISWEGVTKGSELTYQQTVAFGSGTTTYSIKGVVSQALYGSVTGTPIEAQIATDGTVTIKKGNGVVHVQATNSTDVADYYLTVVAPLSDNSSKGYKEHTWRFYDRISSGSNGSETSGTWTADGTPGTFPITQTFYATNEATQTIHQDIIDIEGSDGKTYNTKGDWTGYDASNTTRPMWYYKDAVEGNNGFIVQETAGLIISAPAQKFSVRSAPRMNWNGSKYVNDGNNIRGIGLREGATLTIPKLKKGTYIDLDWGRYGFGSGEKITVSNATDLHGKPIPMLTVGGSFNSSGAHQGYYTFRAAEDGDVTLTAADGGTLRFFEIHVYYRDDVAEGEEYYDPCFDDAITEYEPQAHTEEKAPDWYAANAAGIFMEKEGVAQYVTFTYHINMGGPNGTVRMELKGWDDTLEDCEFNENFRTIHPGSSAYYQIPRFRFYGGWGKARIKATAYDNDLKYVVAEKEYIITVGKKPEIEQYPYTWDFTQYLAATADSINSGANNTWGSNTTDSIKTVDFDEYGKANYQSYYVPGAQLVAENDGIVRDMQGLGWEMANTVANKHPTASTLSFNMEKTVTQAELDGTTDESDGDTGSSRQKAPRKASVVYTPGAGYANLTGTITVPRPSGEKAEKWASTGKTWGKGGYRIYVKSDQAPTPTDATLLTAHDGGSGVYVFEPTDPDKDAKLTFTDAKVYQIGVTNVTKELTPVGDYAWATESREVDINHELTGYFTANDAEAYIVNYKDYDLDSAKVTLTKVGRVDQYNGVVIKQKYKDGGVTAVSPTGGALADGTKVTVPLFYNAISTPKEDLTDNLLQPVYRIWDTERAETDSVLRTKKVFKGDHEEDGYTHFFLSNIHWTWDSSNEYVKPDGTTGTVADVYNVDAAGFYRLHFTDTGDPDADLKENTLEGHKAWLRVKALPTAVWNSGDAATQARRRGTIAIAGAGGGTDSATGITELDGSGEGYDDISTRITEGWYTTSGTKLLDRPTKPGLYIFNGRKVVVR